MFRTRITKARGKQGGAVINALLALTPQPFRIHALSRNPKSTSSFALAFKGIHVIRGTTTSPAPILAQLLPLHGIFLVTLPTSDEEDQALPLIDAAIQHGVKHFIYTPADRGGPEQSEVDETPILHFQTKMRIERYLKDACEERSAMQWTVLRPTSFMDNFAPGFVGKCVVSMMPQVGDTRIALISARDIGRVAAKVFIEPERYAGRALTLTSDLLRWNEIEEVFREENGRDMEGTWEVVVNGLQLMMPSSLSVSMKWIREGGYDYEIDVELARQLDLRDFRAWLKEDSKF